jgi:hypothetical protein
MQLADALAKAIAEILAIWQTHLNQFSPMLHYYMKSSMIFIQYYARYIWIYIPKREDLKSVCLAI